MHRSRAVDLLTSIAVVIPAYNAASHLGPTLRSVLAQTRPADEVIVVDDGSSDDTAGVARSFGGVRYLRQDNAGVSAARNRGVDAATADWVAFLDSDDLFAPRKLELQEPALGPGVVAASTGAALVDSGLHPLAIRRPELPDPPDELLTRLFTEGNLVGSPSSVLARREVLTDLGGFDERLSFTADWDLWIRLARAGRFACVDEPLIAYRLHEESMSSDPDLVETDSISMLERALDDPSNPSAIAHARGRILARQWSVAAGCHRQAGNHAASVRCIARGAAASPATQLRAIGSAIAHRLGRSAGEAVGSDRLGSSAHVSVTPAGPGDDLEWLEAYAEGSPG